MTEKKYSRILLKLSGEMLGGEAKSTFDIPSIELIAGEIANVHSNGLEIGVVIGGGNIFRGSHAEKMGMERTAADYMGMLATCINGLALQEVLEHKFQLPTRMMTAIHMPELAEPYIRRRAIKHLSDKRVVIFAGGTGNPLFTTDTAASLRARETESDIILKATKVDGIYTSDPHKSSDATKISSLTHLEVITKNLKVMDATSITMCMEAHLPIKVFKLDKPGCVMRALMDPSVGTLVH
jgi:uridylate kinase